MYILGAQMGAKAPIWLDVRTVASAPNERRGLRAEAQDFDATILITCLVPERSPRP